MVKKKPVLPYNNLEVCTNAKGHFRSLCTMYERVGELLAAQSRSLDQKIRAVDSPSSQDVLLRIIQQNQEIGEELKNLGAYLDLMPGKNVLLPEESEQKFVSNIEPEKKDRKEYPYLDEDGKTSIDIQDR